ncbi:MAG: transposase [Lentisphaeria bacterium]|nr:transposase [Lentisphaeria bacterium]NQZ66948.1 transposase [Lentisphaeria bacterium]
MRQPRIKIQLRGSYYHVMNRITGDPEEYPFTDADKEFFINLMGKLASFYTVDIISYCIMGNHFHIIFHIPGEILSRPATVERYNTYYEENDKVADLNYHGDVETSEWMLAKIDSTRSKMRDLSCFMSALQKQYTTWYNDHHHRRGSLWGGRFKSVVLEGDLALWNCAKYVELNPVRAKMVKDPGDYKHSTWGFWKRTGICMFDEPLRKHLSRSIGHPDWDWSRIAEKFSLSMQRTMSYQDKRVPGWEHAEKDWHGAVEKVEQGRSSIFDIESNEKVRHFSSGLILGCESFVRSVAAEAYGLERAQSKRLDKLTTKNSELFSYNQAR